MPNKKDEVLKVGGYLKPEAPPFGIGNMVYRHTFYYSASNIPKQHADCFDVKRRELDAKMRAKIAEAKANGESMVPASHPCAPPAQESKDSTENESLLSLDADKTTAPTEDDADGEKEKISAKQNSGKGKK